MKLVIVLVAILALAHADYKVKTAVAKIVGDSISGSVIFSQGSDSVTVLGEVSGLQKGKHGFHIHEIGNVTNGCDGTGSHFNPTKKHHGGPDDSERHVGDLGNIEATGNGVTVINIKDKLITLNGEHSIIGRSVVIHSDEDDLGKGGSEFSNTTGNAGIKIACGVIGISTEDDSNSTIQVVSNMLTIGLLIFFLKMTV